jgi:Skp family chaperone for outer membrane proteins
MKSKTATLLALLLAGLLTLGIACGDDNGDTVDTTPAIDIATATTTAPDENGEADDRDDFINTIEARLEQLQTQIDELESELENVSEDAREDAQARLDDLKEQKENIEADLEEAQSADDGQFEQLRTDIEQRVDNAMTEAQELAQEIGI